MKRASRLPALMRSWGWPINDDVTRSPSSSSSSSCSASSAGHETVWAGQRYDFVDVGGEHGAVVQRRRIRPVSVGTPPWKRRLSFSILPAFAAAEEIRRVDDRAFLAVQRRRRGSGSGSSSVVAPPRWDSAVDCGGRHKAARLPRSRSVASRRQRRQSHHDSSSSTWSSSAAAVSTVSRWRQHTGPNAQISVDVHHRWVVYLLNEKISPLTIITV